MAGGFLPPVVTTLDGDIKPLLAELGKAKAAIKDLGNTRVRINVDFNVNQASLAKALASTKALQLATSGLSANNINAARSNNSMATSLLAIDAANKRLSGGGSGRRMPGWFGWIADPANIDALHGAAVALTAIGAGLMGAAIGAGALGAAWAKGGLQIAAQSKALYVAASAQGIPLGQAFGFKPNPAWVSAQQAGTGQLYSFLGGITAYMNKNQSPLLANEGGAIGAWLATAAAKADLAKNNGSAFNAFMGTVNYDAINLGRGFKNIGLIAGKTIAHSPGDIEWLTSAFSGLTGAAWKGVNTPVGGELLSGLMMLHGLTFMSGLMGKGLGALGIIDKGAYPLHGLFGALGTSAVNLLGGLIGTGTLGSKGGGMAAMLMRGAVKADGKTGLGWLSRLLEKGSYLGAGMGSGITGVGLGMAGGIGAMLMAMGLYGYKVANSPSQQQLMTSGWLNRIANDTTYPKTTGDIAKAMQQITSTNQSNLVKWNSTTPGRSARQQYLQAVYGGYTGVDTVNNNDALYRGMLKVGTSVHNETAGINAAAKAFGGLAMAQELSSAAGVKWQNVTAGNKKATQAQLQVIRNFIQEYTNLTGANAGKLAMVNAAAVKTVSSKQWQNMANVNSAFDTYVGMMTQGPNALGGILNSLAGIGPSLSLSKFLKTNSGSLSSFINTNQSIGGSLQPLMDFYRQGLSMGAMTLPQFQHGVLSAAASLGPLAKNNPYAQQELVGMARQSGLKVTGFSDLLKQAGGVNKALADTVKLTQMVSGNFAKLGPLGQQVAQIMMNDTANAFAHTAEMGGQVATATQNVVKAMTQYPGHSAQVVAAAKAQAQALFNNGLTAKQVTNILKSEGLGWVKLPQGMKKQTVSTNAKQAAGDINSAGAAWAKLPNNVIKRMTVETFFVTFGNPNPNFSAGKYGQGGWGHTALGVRNRVMGGWSWVGERGPELMYQPPGTTVIPHNQTGQMMANARSYGPAGDTHVHVYIDSKELFGAVKVRTQQYNATNGNRTKGGRVRGTMVPRNG